MTSVVQQPPKAKKGIFSRLFAHKPTPVETLESEGYEGDEARRALESYNWDLARARTKLQHDKHAKGSDGLPLAHFPYVEGCRICDALATVDEVHKGLVPEHPEDHVRYDAPNNMILYVNGCDQCEVLRYEDSEGRAEGNAFTLRNDRLTQKALGVASAWAMPSNGVVL
ncbi:uncharacterized protein LOC62_06G008554 [Vanrija pseudolonga]|uniref:Uncharacterized protein n=1 Tax=Vanrija pseudolonga TaxID=143232 RepID=A0AAF0YH78_9TREE|nr:hypothetical protein LOC62_06G008554 [Vanrija pseudolonga]